MSDRSKQAFLATFDQEHAITMRLLRAYPEDKLDLKASPVMKTARELAWVFVSECGLGQHIWNDAFKNGMPPGRTGPPPPPQKWSDLLAALEKATAEFRSLIANASPEELEKEVHFFTGPKKIGAMTRINMAWFLLHDQIHHRGQFSVYLRMAGAKVPSIYGPTADEQWM